MLWKIFFSEIKTKKLKLYSANKNLVGKKKIALFLKLKFCGKNDMVSTINLSILYYTTKYHNFTCETNLNYNSFPPANGILSFLNNCIEFIGIFNGSSIPHFCHRLHKTRTNRCIHFTCKFFLFEIELNFLVWKKTLLKSWDGNNWFYICSIVQIF